VHSLSMLKIKRQVAEGRALHLIDLENLCGGTRPSPGLVAAIEAAYRLSAPVGPMDQTVLGTSEAAARAMYFNWGGPARWVHRSGPDGADLKLLEVLEQEQVVGRFGRVVIGSGDGVFADCVGYLQQLGVQVTVVCGHGALSKRLQFAAREVVQLHFPSLQATQMAVAA